MKKNLVFALCLLFLTGSLGAEESGFKFKTVNSSDATPVKHQFKTGTCWSFATSSFLESELIRLGKGRHDLSEMYVVRMIYPQKIKNYVRYHGKTQFGEGSLSGDLLRIVRDHGMMPNSAFPGLLAGQSKHDHQEMDAVLKGALDGLVKNRSRRLSKAWTEAFEGILNAYLGEPPSRFSYQGKQYTPRSFADDMGIRAEDYLEFTSYSHHPYYQNVTLKLPDNWHGNTYYNVPLKEFLQVVDSALDKGYTLGWDGDVTEHSYHRERGIATLPVKAWDDRTKKEKEEICLKPEAELLVTQAVRQEHFDNYSTEDDHLMHITGKAQDQNGTDYYLVKNSAGTLERAHEGYVYMSEAYFRSKTISILVHKDAVPQEIAAKLQ